MLTYVKVAEKWIDVTTELLTFNSLIIYDTVYVWWKCIVYRLYSELTQRGDIMSLVKHVISVCVDKSLFALINVPQWESSLHANCWPPQPAMTDSRHNGNCRCDSIH